MALDEADCNEQSGRQESPDREKSEGKNKTQLWKSIIVVQAGLPARTWKAAAKSLKSPKTKACLSLDKRRFHTRPVITMLTSDADRQRCFYPGQHRSRTESGRPQHGRNVCGMRARTDCGVAVPNRIGCASPNQPSW